MSQPSMEVDRSVFNCRGSWFVSHFRFHIFQLTVIHPTMPDSVKEIEISVAKSEAHKTAKDSHRQVIS